MLRNSTPCDEPALDGKHYCPYMDATGYVDCAYWCGDDGYSDDPAEWEDWDE